MTSISTIEVSNVTKLFGPVRALAGVSLTVKRGDVTAIMGGNGAGKSTLLSLLALSSKPTRGDVRFNGQTPSEIDGIRGRIGLLAHDPMVYPDLTAEENLIFFARLMGIRDAEHAVFQQVEQMALGDFFKDRPCRVLSRGQLQRVSLARALLAEPDVLLLDEPAAGLDSKATARIEAAVLKLVSNGGMAVVVTHEPEVAAAIASRAVMLRRGRIIMDVAAPSTSDDWRSLYAQSQEGLSP